MPLRRKAAPFGLSRKARAGVAGRRSGGRPIPCEWFEEECTQTLGDCLTTLEERISQNEDVMRNVAKVQTRSVDALKKMRGTLAAQQGVLNNIN